jgi:hypothetical protein
MQRPKQSLIETLSGTAIGFAVSLLGWEFVVKPVWHIETSFVENLNITLFFTVLSIARGYAVRRIFNHLHTKNKKKDANDSSDRNYRTRTLRQR